MDDLRKKNTTYGFRNTGRRPNSATAFAPSGGTLLPGAYEHKDFLEHSFKRPMAYSFRTIDRDSGPKIGHGYGDKVATCKSLNHVQHYSSIQYCYQSFTFQFQSI